MKSDAQFELFDDIPKSPVVSKEPDFYDKTMAVLKKLGKEAEKTNEMLQGLIDDIQADWSEEDKLQLSNPKEYQRLQQLKLEKDKEVEVQAKISELTGEAIEILKQSQIENNTLKLPAGQLDRKIYLEVKNRIELIGGKWKGHKIQGFVFDTDPSELVQQLVSGKQRNLKKEFQFFATPDSLADYIVELAEITNYNNILEPSAGQGAIIKAIHKVCPAVVVDYCELMDINRTVLKKLSTISFVCDDFLQFRNHREQYYDRIIANPPFSKNQDVDHIRQMYSLLSPGGRLVSISSKHWQHSTNKKELDFKQWLDDLGARIEEVPAGEFKESGTNISTCIVIIDKH